MAKLVFLALGAAAIMAGCAYHENGNSSAQQGRSANSRTAVADLSPASGSQVKGSVTFTQEGVMTRVEASLSGLTPGRHGFHIHEKGDCSAPDATSAGGHFNPSGMNHGGPGAHDRHAGDFGNVEADSSGNARFSKLFPNLQFEGAASFIGRAVIIHANPDDLTTQPTGNAGGRVACGVIRLK